MSRPLQLSRKTYLALAAALPAAALIALLPSRSAAQSTGAEPDDVVEVGGAVRSLPRVQFVPVDEASVTATKELARLVSLTGLYTTATLAPNTPAGGLVVKVLVATDSLGPRIEASTTTTAQGSPKRRILQPNEKTLDLDNARLADAIVADLSGERSHLSGTLLFVDASTPGERRVKAMLGSGAQIRDISPEGMLARGADTHPGGTVYFAAARQGEPMQLHAEGKADPIALKVTGFVQSVAFSPEGQAAIVAGEREGGALYLGLLGARMARVDTGAGIAIGPTFGPSGQLAYAAGPADGPLRIFVDRQPVSPAGAWASAPSFCSRAASKGESAKPRIAYMLKQGNSWSTVVTELSGGGSFTVGSGSYPACSPDGRTIALGRTARGRNPAGVYLLGTDGIAASRVKQGEIGGLRWTAGPPLPPEG